MRRLLEKRGFVVVRQRGSHMILRHALGHRVTLAYHAGKTIHPRILAIILEDAGLRVEDLHDEGPQSGPSVLSALAFKSTSHFSSVRASARFTIG